MNTSSHEPPKNVSTKERIVSGVLGGIFLLRGMGRGSLMGAALATIGGALIKRAASGHCSIYQSMGVHPVATKVRRIR